MKTKSENGFTLIDLLVVAGVLAVLVGVCVPALANGRVKSDAARCMSNLKQLILGWDLYHHDNNGRLVMNFNGGQAIGGAAASNPNNAPWAVGWLDWSISSDNTNILFLVDEKYAKLAKYVGKDSALFRCPADRFVSYRQRALGWTHRSRSYSANVGIGDGNAQAGPWDSLYKQIKTVSGFVYPGPSETYVFIEEHPCSMNDPALFNPGPARWIDQPSSLHDGAAVLAFADGHVQIHKWAASLATARAQRVDTNRSSPDASAVVGDADIH